MDELTHEFLVESQEGLDRMERCLTDLEARPDDSSLLAEIFRAVHTIKGTTGFLGFKRLETLAHSGENLLGKLRDRELPVTPAIISGLLALLDVLRSILKVVEGSGHEGQADDEPLLARLEELQQPQASQAPAKRRKSSARAAAARPLEPAPAAPVAVDDPLPSAAALPDTPLHAPPAISAAESTLRVDIGLLNRMMNLVGELVLTRNQVLQATAADPRMTVLSRRLDMVTADLRESVMKARMQPVSNIFSKLPRIVRDVSQTVGRRVRLQMEGQDTELDKSLLEAIKDPLTHAVRNALDHGIELPEDRIAAGKDPEGTLRVSASQEGSHVVVSIADDGAGINVDRIRAKAIERGLITAERAALLGEHETLHLIFLPGFSTAATITNVSGRGVGMDVVRTNVERIGGKVEIDSRLGAGTTLRLRIPLTLAIIPALIVRSLSQSFALPEAALSELVKVSVREASAAIEWIEDAPLYRLRGNLLPLVFLSHVLQPASGLRHTLGDECFIAVLDADGRRFGLVVDGLADPEEIVVKPLSGVLKDIGIFSGATVLGNADLALILDPGAIASRAHLRSAAETEADAVDVQLATVTGDEYLLVEIGSSRAAVRVSQVLRIEQIPAARIERVRGGLLLHASGFLFPVEDPGGLLHACEPEAQVIIVVCRDGTREAGIVVSHVLDVVTGGELAEAGSRNKAEGLLLFADRITEVMEPASNSHFEAQPDGAWDAMNTVEISA